MKKLLLYVVLLMTVGCAMLGCTGQDYFYDGDYVYWIDYKSKYATLLEVKNIEDKEVLEVPLSANGFDVMVIGGNVNMHEYQIQCDNTLDIHLPYTVNSVTSSAFSSNSLKRVFVENCLSITKDLTTRYVSNSSLNFYVHPLVFDKYKDYYSQVRQTVSESLKKANVCFWFNYENSHNLGVYRLGYVEEDGYINSPKIIPNRIGYRFAGWFLDKDCTQKFNFETKINSVEDYNLYAKWEE